jgi:uncharacterized membrane protein
MSLQTKYFTHCVPVRSLIAIGISATPDKYMKYLTIPAGIASGIGLYRYFNHTDEETGVHKQLVWWNNNRLIHSLVSIIFIILIIQNKNNYAKMIPFIDIILGILLVTKNYSTKQNNLN